MLLEATPILADLPILARSGDDDGWAKFVGLAIVAVIWIIGAIATSIQNAKKKRQEEAAAARLSRTAAPIALPTSMLPVPPPLQYRAAPPAIPVAKARPAERRPAAAPTAPPLAQVMRDSRAREALATAPSVAPAALDAPAVRRWLTPQVMQQQFVLTELFDRPPSAR